MEKQNLLIVGLGSMGRRRAGLMRYMDTPFRLFGVDQLPNRRLQAEEAGIDTWENLEQALAARRYAAAFVCTAPLAHAPVIDTLLEADVPVFTELNLVADGYERLMEKAARKELPLFLSSTMLYRREPQYIIQSVADFANPVNYLYHIGQYLPDWHPWENYKDFFVGQERSGGVREILAVELPWLVTAFGPVAKVEAHCRTVSGLELPYADSCMALLRHENGTLGTLAADVVSPKAVRNFELYGEGLHLFWEGRPDALYRYDPKAKEKFPVDTYADFIRDKRYSDNIVEDAYLEEMRNFFAVLKGREAPRWSFEKDAQVLRLIDDMKVDGPVGT